MEKQNTKIRPAVAATKATDFLGGAAEAAHKLGVSLQMVYMWRGGGRRVSAEHCMALEKATGRAVTCEELRPDIDWSYMRQAQSEAVSE